MKKSTMTLAALATTLVGMTSSVFADELYPVKVRFEPGVGYVNHVYPPVYRMRHQTVAYQPGVGYVNYTYPRYGVNYVNYTYPRYNRYNVVTNSANLTTDVVQDSANLVAYPFNTTANWFR